MSDRRPTGIKGSTPIPRTDCEPGYFRHGETIEVCAGDGVWGEQPDHYGVGQPRFLAGEVFWNELAREWRVCEGQFADFYTARDHPESLGYPLAKLQKLLVFKLRS